MRNLSPDIDTFEKNMFRSKQNLSKILRFSIEIMEARIAGLIYGTDQSREMFLPPDIWDRGIIHKFEGKGKTGRFFKYFGRFYINRQGLSPVHMFKKNRSGDLVENEGIIAHVLKTYVDFYKKGIRVLLINNIETYLSSTKSPFLTLPVYSYDGRKFQLLNNLKANRAIIRKFFARNFIAAYIPDYGAMVIDTSDVSLLRQENGYFLQEKELKKRLDLLIRAIETASIAFLGSVKGKKATELIWRKERNLREIALELNKKEVELEKQKSYLRAVGGVTEAQLNMEPITIDNGTYAFVDMVGSSRLRDLYSPGNYFFMTNVCRQIAVNLASAYGCRLGNFIGDALFFQNVYPFDPEESTYHPKINERVVLMVLFLVSLYREIHRLISGGHPIDRQKKIKSLLKQHKQILAFRSGIDTGPATVGPVGSRRRMMVTAIGAAVDNASRLECTGLPNEIHMSENVMSILKNAQISRSEKIVYSLFSEKNAVNGSMYQKERQILINNRSVSFFDFYRSGFKPSDRIIQKRCNICYKEFSPKATYLFNWDRKQRSVRNTS